jgi:hypothetical protein
MRVPIRFGSPRWSAGGRLAAAWMARFATQSASMRTRPGARDFVSRFLGGTCENRLADQRSMVPVRRIFFWRSNTP